MSESEGTSISSLIAAGYFIGGVDEAGRGPLAGPVSAAAVVFPSDYDNSEIRDSKKVSEKKREKLFELIKDISLAYSIVFIEPDKIDQVNIREATRLAMARAAEEVAQSLLSQFPDRSVHFLVDGNTKMATSLSHETIIQGDSKVRVISAASILAKVARDRKMKDLDRLYPGYEFSVHKGYPTKLHKEKIRQLGPCPIHRMTFSGVRAETS